MTEDLTTQDPNEMPAFMEGDEHGTELLGQYVQPPRIKVVQKSSGPPFDEMFGVGEVIAVPHMIRIAGIEGKNGHPFHFVPVFFFPEWCLWNPIELKGIEPAIVERTTDPTSRLVVLSRDPAVWSVDHPTAKDKKGQPLQRRYVEHLNFVVVLIGEHELAGSAAVLTFAKAEHRAGSSFASLIKMRKAALYGCQFEGRVGYRTNNKGNWFGIDVSNPSGDSGLTPFVTDRDDYDGLKAIHEEMRQAHEHSKIKVDYEETPEDVVDNREF
jgi:hypothetical protein